MLTMLELKPCPFCGGKANKVKFGKIQMFECEKYYKMAKKILIENREFLDKIAHELMEKETILQSDIKRIKESCKIKNFEF